MDSDGTCSRADLPNLSRTPKWIKMLNKGDDTIRAFAELSVRLLPDGNLEPFAWLAEGIMCEAAVARYYFDIQDRGFHRDDEGSECKDFEAARKEAMKSLPEIARWAIPQDGDNQTFNVLVRDEAGTVVYTATLTFAGLRSTGASQ